MLDALVVKVPRGRPHRQRLRRPRHRRQPRGLPREPRPRHRHLRRRRGLARVPRGLVARGLAGVQLVSSDAHPGLVDAIRSTLPGRVLAALPHALHAQPAHPRAQERPASRRDDGAHDLRPADARPVHEQHGRIVAQLQSASRTPQRCSRRPGPTCSPSPASPRSTGGSSGATTRSSG